MIRVAILDDESKSIRSLVYELEQFEDRVEIVAQYTSVEEAFEQLSDNQLDCLFFGYRNARNGWFPIFGEIASQDL